jgi:hypothetical protein
MPKDSRWVYTAVSDSHLLIMSSGHRTRYQAPATLHALGILQVWDMRKSTPLHFRSGVLIVSSNPSGTFSSSLSYRSTDLKYDNCGVPANWTDQYTSCVPDGSNPPPNGTCTSPNPPPQGYNWSTSNTAERYRRMGDALRSQKRPIFYSLCDWGQANVQEWGKEVGRSWRMTGDIERKSILCHYAHGFLTQITWLSLLGSYHGDIERQFFPNEFRRFLGPQ